MTSVLRYTAQPKKNPTSFFTVTIPSYSDTNVGEIMPIPFYVTKEGVLEIRIQDNVQTNLLNVGTFIGLDNQPFFQCKVMGGVELVTSLGQTTKDFLTAWIHNQEGNNSPSGEFELIVKPVMTKLQFSTNPDQFQNEQTAELSDYAPSSSEYVTGEEVNVYRTAWTFQSPMTVKYYSVQNSKYKYANLTAAFDSI